jgi:hypothetical protein
MKHKIIFFIICFWGAAGQLSHSAEIPISEATAECLVCHEIIHPGIVEDWRKSNHANITPKQAIAVGGLARKISSTSVAEKLQGNVVGCAECHTLRPDAHADTFEHNGYRVHIVVSPNDCQTCHAEESNQFKNNLMSHAYGNLTDNPVYQALEHSILAQTTRKDGLVVLNQADTKTKEEACYYCHGTKLEVIGSETRETEIAGELTFPRIKGWPNQGVGRINLDGSRGSCSACHTRHTFSIEMARKPYTCKECHIGPDVPVVKVYESSKHGNIFSAMNKSWNFTAVPWTIGKDFSAPTCAVCHISLLVNTEGEVVAKRSHQMNNRIPWRLFGLIYAHPHPIDPNTSIIRNNDGLPLPTDFNGEFAKKYLINAEEQKSRKQSMQKICLNCHDQDWVDGHWERFKNTIQQTNSDTLTATNIMLEIWQNGLAQGLAQEGNPFDEFIEKKWSDTWLFYANTIRFASAMAGGGDYGVYANGRYHFIQSIMEMHDWLDIRKKDHSNDSSEKK